MPAATHQGDIERLKLLQLVFAGLAATFLDILTTYYALHHLSGHELNPLAALGISSFGLRDVLLVGVLIRIGIVGALALIMGCARQPLARTTASVVLTGVDVWWLLIGVSNLVMLVITVS
jgi:hypothetical protein